MSAISDGLRQIYELANPRTMIQLRRAGALDPKSPYAIARALPWLIGRGPSLGVVAQMNARVLGDKPAIYDRNGTLSWRELDNRSNQVARALDAAGLAGGDRIALLTRNGREMAEVILGAQKAGVVCCPLNTWAKPKELKEVFQAVAPAFLLFDSAHSDQVKACAPEGLPLVHIGESVAVAGSLPYEELIEEQPVLPMRPFTLRRSPPKVIIQTSGTTGTPKGASRDAAGAGMGALANLISVVPYRRDDVVFCPAPLFHSFGLATFTFATALGATLVLPDKFDPQRSLELIEEHGASAASFVPVMIRRILSLDAGTKDKYDLSSLRIVLASGSVLTEDIRRGARELFGDVLYDLYGSTEAGWVAIATPEDMARNKATVGQPVPGIDIAVFSPDGDRLNHNETGELFVKSSLAFEGYTSGDSKDERDGYMSIGDVGHVDEDGYLFVEGRADDMVVVGGENVYPIEIERCIEDLEGVDEVAVLGVADDEYGQILVAFVSGSATTGEVVSHCKSELASYKVPRRVEIMDELPRTTTGKVIKRELQATATES